MRALLFSFGLVFASTAAGFAATAPASVDTCTLITGNDVAGATHLKVTKQQRLAATGACQYTLATKGLFGSYVTITERPGNPRYVSEYAKNAATTLHANYLPLKGVGERAMYDKQGVIAAAKGHFLLIAFMTNTIPEDKRVDAATALVKLAISRL